jgi:acetolactate synthase I/III small subunit
MSLPVPGWVLSVLLDDDLLAFNRAVGILRRRNLAVAGVTFGPSSRGGLARLTCVVVAEADAVERLANQLRKMSGAAEVVVAPEAGCTVREHVLVRVPHPGGRLRELLDLAALYDARVITETTAELVLEATGAPPTVGALIRALEPFDGRHVARSGTLALAGTAGVAGPAVRTVDTGAGRTAIPA